jgi:hypothetical protein
MRIETSDPLVNQVQRLEEAAILSSTLRTSKFGSAEYPPNSFAIGLVSKLMQPLLNFQHNREQTLKPIPKPVFSIFIYNHMAC